jgi:hypothetical protein
MRRAGVVFLTTLPIFFITNTAVLLLECADNI